MAPAISQIVRQLKADAAKVLEPAAIFELCSRLKHAWRKRVLDPAATVHVFLLQILHGNVACSAMPGLVDLSISATAYCAARMRLPLKLFEELLGQVCRRVSADLDEGRWLGHRTWTLDGSTFSMPDTRALQAHFGQPTAQAPGCGFPTAHLLALFHAGTGLLLHAAASCWRTHDMQHAAETHQAMGEGDVLVADRGLASYVHLVKLSLRKMHAVFRCHHAQIVSFRVGRKHTGQRKPAAGLPRSRYVKRLGTCDQVVEYSKPKNRPSWIDAAEYAALPETLLVRELRYKVKQRGSRTREVTLVTTLLDAEKYAALELANLYRRRWQIEINFRHLKTTMKMEVLHCQTVDGVRKELCMFAVAYNLVRLAMLEAAHRQKAPVERISFIDALRWLREARPGQPMRKLMVNPDRPDRIEPRAIKRRPKPHKLIKKPREILRKSLTGKSPAA